MITSPAVIRTARALLRVAPVSVVRGLAIVVASAAYYVQGERRRTILGNLARLAPNETGRRRRRLARRTFRNFVSAAVDLWRVPGAAPDEVLALVAVRGRENLDAAVGMGKGVIASSAHLGPYELGGVWATSVGYPLHIMVEDLEPKVSEALATYRTATGMRLISMKQQGLRGVYRLLRGQQLVGLNADRTIGDQRGAVILPFGNGERPVPTGPAAFSIATGAPIVVWTITRNPDRRPRYLLEFDPPLLPSGRGDEERLRLTRLVIDRLAAAVQDHPDEWYVFQPQWVSSDRD